MANPLQKPGRTCEPPKTQRKRKAHLDHRGSQSIPYVCRRPALLPALSFGDSYRYETRGDFGAPVERLRFGSGADPHPTNPGENKKGVDVPGAKNQRIQAGHYFNQPGALRSKKTQSQAEPAKAVAWQRVSRSRFWSIARWKGIRSTPGTSSGIFTG